MFSLRHDHVCVLMCLLAVTSADDFYTAGLALAVSLVNEGPAPHFFSIKLFDALVFGPENVSFSLEDMPQCQLKDELQQVGCCTSTKNA